MGRSLHQMFAIEGGKNTAATCSDDGCKSGIIYLCSCYSQVWTAKQDISFKSSEILHPTCSDNLCNALSATAFQLFIQIQKTGILLICEPPAIGAFTGTGEAYNVAKQAFDANLSNVL